MSGKKRVPRNSAGATPAHGPGLKRLLACFEGHEPIASSSHPRGFHAPLHVWHEIDAVRFLVEADEPGATAEMAGVAFAGGRPSPPFALACGRNLFPGVLRGADGRAGAQFNCKVFRAYPHPAWRRLLPAAPWAPRDSAGELVFRDRLWLLGGFIPETVNDTWSSADGVAWGRGADVPTRSGIDIPVVFAFKDRMWVSDLDGVLFSSPDGRSWSAAGKPPWRGRVQAGCAVFDGRVWVMGGGLKDGTLFNDVWSSPDGVNWTLELRHAPWSKRMIHHAPVVLDGRLWLLGGGVVGSDYYPFTAWNDVWSSPDGRRWEKVLEHAPWPARIWGASAVYRDRLWLLGGFRSEPAWENLGDCWYSPDGADWRRFDPLPAVSHSGVRNEAFAAPGATWTRRHEHSVWVKDDALWLAGGMEWPLVNDVWRLGLPGLVFLSQPAVEACAGALFEDTVRADFNRSRRPVRYRLERGPAWLRLDGKTGRLRGVAPRAAGDFALEVAAFDGAGETVRRAYTLHVVNITR